MDSTRIKYPIGLLLFLIFALGCQETEKATSKEEENVFTSRYSLSELEEEDLFITPAVSRGVVDLKEASGLAYSQKNPGHIWSHQDKNNDNSLFLINESSGEIIATYQILGTENRDWEDIEIGPGPQTDLPYLYIGEVGDNKMVYGTYKIYRFEEPFFEEAHRGKTIKLNLDYDEIIFKYPNRNHDAETLMVDPWTKDIYLVSKRSVFSRLYALPYPQKINELQEANYLGSFAFRFATAGTFSRDGKEALIKNYDNIFYWERSDNQSVFDMLSQRPLILPYEPKEEQGEAICFDPWGNFFTLSEKSKGVVPQLFFYERKR